MVVRPFRAVPAVKTAAIVAQWVTSDGLRVQARSTSWEKKTTVIVTDIRAAARICVLRW